MRYRARASGATLLGAALVVACGSRSPLLELEGFDEGFGGSSSKAGSTSRGGTGAAGAPVGSAGKPSTEPGNTATEPCRRYCSGYSITCAQELEDDNCQALCESELNAPPPSCRNLGVDSVRCLTPFFQVGSGSCAAATDRGLAQCGATLAKFKACSGADKPSPMPNPTPSPMPNPTPNPGTEPASCPNRGAVSPTSCQMSFACARGLYEVSCKTNPEGNAAHCSCARGGERKMFDLSLFPSSSACQQAFPYCP